MDPTDPTQPRDAPDRSQAGLMPRRGYVLALVVLLGSVVGVFAFWSSARERELRAADAAFGVRTVEIIDRLQRRLVNYELLARAGTSLFASVARPTPREWADYVDGMNLPQRFPAIVGLGFAGYVSNNRLDDLQIEWREAGYGQLNVLPRGIRGEYGPVLYLEPRTAQNIAAIGTDMLTEPMRRHAMQLAMESASPQLTGPIDVPRGASAGIVMFTPIYRSGEHPRTRTTREASTQGWIFLPFDMERYVAVAIGDRYDDIGFRIYDVSGPKTLLYARGQASTEPPAFHRSEDLSLYGRQWRIEFDSPPVAAAAPHLKGLENLLSLGLVASLLLYGLVWLMARTEDRAYAIALRLTEDYRRSEQRFRTSMQYSAIGKALLNSEGRIVEANPALGRILGRSIDSLIGERFESLFEGAEPERPPQDRRMVPRVTRHLRREGDLPRQAQLTYAPVPGNIGQDVTDLVQVEDVTDRVRAEAQIQALNRTLEARVALRTRELSQVNQELEAFAYSVSHDLRAPLRAIDGFSKVLSERYAGQLDEAGRDYLLRVRKAAGRMGELIDAILKISRLSRIEVHREPIDLSRLAVDVLDELRAGEPQREVEVRIQPNLRAQGDPTLLRSLLFNLLGNAWKFTRECPLPLIEFGAVEDAQGELEYYVRDNGAGFSSAYADKLFRPFQRLHSQDEFSGHGIGLASVKRIIERHGGRIRAEGSEGEGAVFWFTLPTTEEGPDWSPEGPY